MATEKKVKPADLFSPTCNHFDEFKDAVNEVELLEDELHLRPLRLQPIPQRQDRHRRVVLQ
jgi:hypothetical protein